MKSQEYGFQNMKREYGKSRKELFCRIKESLPEMDANLSREILCFFAVSGKDIQESIGLVQIGMQRNKNGLTGKMLILIQNMKLVNCIFTKMNCIIIHHVLEEKEI